MQLINVNHETGDLIFNWGHLPEKISVNIELRNKIFKELQNKFKVVSLDSVTLFEMNRYAINRIKAELKDVLSNRSSNEVA